MISYVLHFNGARKSLPLVKIYLRRMFTFALIVVNEDLKGNTNILDKRNLRAEIERLLELLLLTFHAYLDRTSSLRPFDASVREFPLYAKRSILPMAFTIHERLSFERERETLISTASSSLRENESLRSCEKAVGRYF